jgi:hypothetical protein
MANDHFLSKGRDEKWENVRQDILEMVIFRTIDDKQLTPLLLSSLFLISLHILA